MRTIKWDIVKQNVSELCERAAHELPQDVLDAIGCRLDRETNPLAKDTLEKLLENAKTAKEQRIPLCQDTGLTVVFVRLGSEVFIDAPDTETLESAIQLGVADGYEKGYLRKSVVAEPLDERKNTGTNTPAVVHIEIVPGDKLELTVMAKGGGCENKSQFKMFKPTAKKEEVVDWIVDVVKTTGADACPPFVVGIGIGGNFEKSAILSKKALCRKLGSKHADPFYAQMETQLMETINASNVGPQGMGGDTTALGVLIETDACHIASLPVSVNMECHSHRHKTIIL